MKKINFIIAVLFTLAACQKQTLQDYSYENADTVDEAVVSSGPFVAFGTSTIFFWDYSYGFKTTYKDYNPINVAFPGKTVDGLLLRADTALTKLKARQILVYPGENDIVEGHKSAYIMPRLRKLFDTIRRKNPNAYILWMPIKPSPQAWNYQGVGYKGKETIENCNRFMSIYINGGTFSGITYPKQRDAVMMNTYFPMLKNGYPNPAHFKSDSLHYQRAGYDALDALVKPYLLKTVTTSTIQTGRKAIAVKPIQHGLTVRPAIREILNGRH